MKPRRAASYIVINSDTREVYANGRRARFDGDDVFEAFCLLWRKKQGGLRMSTMYAQLYQLRPDCDKPLTQNGKNNFGIIRTMIHRMRHRLLPLGITFAIIGRGNGCYIIQFTPDSMQEHELKRAA